MYKSPITNEIFINKANIKHNYKYDYTKIQYINNTTKIKIICPIHGVFEQTPKLHLNTGGCFKCGVEKRSISVDQFKDKCNKIYNNKYDYSKVEFNTLEDYVTIICDIHGEFKQQALVHISGKACYACGIHSRWMQVREDSKSKFILNANDIHNNKYDYSNIQYINSYTKIKIICPIHGEFEQKPQDHIHNKNGCPNCNLSHGEQYIKKYLDDNNITYIQQKTFNDCKYKNTLPFDFYLDKYNVCIEYDGIQHFESVDFFGGDAEFVKIKEKDKIKTEYCKNNNLALYRISYIDDIDYKLNEIINKLNIKKVV